MDLFQETQHIMAKYPPGKGNSRHANKCDYILLMNIKTSENLKEMSIFFHLKYTS